MDKAERFRNNLTVILRNIPLCNVRFILSCLHEAGITNLEITLNTADHARIFEIIRSEYPGQFFLGAGTVLSEGDVEKAFEYGAEYIISPNVDERVIRRTKELGLISIPGALSPSEIMTAHDCGADIIKLFPVMHFSPEYVGALMQPFNDLEFLAVGIKQQQIKEYRKLGINCFGAGLGAISKELVSLTDKDTFVRYVREYCSEIV